MSTIALTGGGSGGHIVPLLSLVPYLYEYFDRIIFIGSDKPIDRKLATGARLPFFVVNCAPFSRKNLLKNLALPFSVAEGVKQAKALFMSERPEVVVAKGGYCTVPAALAAKSLGIPVVIHESDLTMGLANRYISSFADTVIGSFPETRGVDVVIGTPVRDAIFSGDASRARKTYGIRSGMPVVLVLGGSQGSDTLNDAVRQTLPRLCEKFWVVHISGNGFLGKSRTGYTEIEYTDAIADLYALADVVVSRGGANALAEITALGKRCIVVPLPKGLSRGDQEDNAISYARREVVKVLPQNELDYNRFFNEITGIFKLPSPRALDIRNNARRIVDEVLKTIERKNND